MSDVVKTTRFIYLRGVELVVSEDVHSDMGYLGMAFDRKDAWDIFIHWNLSYHFKYDYLTKVLDTYFPREGVNNGSSGTN